MLQFKIGPKRFLGPLRQAWGQQLPPCELAVELELGVFQYIDFCASVWLGFCAIPPSAHTLCEKGCN